jgi:hypothetical protein
MPSFRVHRPPAKTAIQGWSKTTGTDRVSTSQKRSLQEDSLNGMRVGFVRVRCPASKSDIRETVRRISHTAPAPGLQSHLCANIQVQNGFSGYWGSSG